MRPNTLRSVLALLGIDKTKPSGTGWIIASCPLAPATHQKGTDSHASLGISLGAGVSFVNCHSCGIRGPLPYLIRALRKHQLITEANAQKALEKCKWVEKNEPRFDDEDEASEVQPQLDPDVLLHLSRYHKYFAGRGYSESTVLAWRAGYIKRNGRIQVLLPSVLPDDTVPYVQVRTRYKGERKFWYMPEGIHRSVVAGTHLLKGTETSIIVCEGLFDAMRTRLAVKELGWRKDVGVVALFGSKPNDDMMEHVMSLVKQELIICSDNDEAGDTCASKLTEAGMKHVPAVSRVILPVGADPDKTGKKKLSVLMRALERRENILATQIRSVLRRYGN